MVCTGAPEWNVFASPWSHHRPNLFRKLAIIADRSLDIRYPSAPRAAFHYRHWQIV